jgi:hypothetical protein
MGEDRWLAYSLLPEFYYVLLYPRIDRALQHSAPDRLNTAASFTVRAALRISMCQARTRPMLLGLGLITNS